MQMFERLNAQQQPFIRSGYNSMGRLNTLLGLGGVPRGMSNQPMPNQQGYIPNRQGGMDMRIPSPVNSAPKSNPRLAQLLALRAQNGDTEAARILGGMQ